MLVFWFLYVFLFEVHTIFSELWHLHFYVITFFDIVHYNKNNNNIKKYCHKPFFFRNLCEDPTHLCTKYCFKVCGPCYYVVEKKLECGHTAKLECHVEPASFKCTVPVMSKLPCGHEARKPCSADPEKFRCPFPCETRVEPCGHACTLGCHAIRDPDHLEVSIFFLFAYDEVKISSSSQFHCQKTEKYCFESRVV